MSAEPTYAELQNRVHTLEKELEARQKLEDQIFKTNDYLTSVIKQAPFAIHILEGDANKIDVLIENDESARIMGQISEGRKRIDSDIPETLQTRFFTINGKVEVPFNQMPSPRAFRGEAVKNEEYLFRHADGTELMVEANAAPIYSTENQIQSVVVTFHDITERKKAEAAIIESEALLNKSQEVAEMGSFVWDLKDDTLTWSHNMYVIHGLDEKTFAGNLQEVSLQLVHPEDQEHIRTEIQDMIEAGSVKQMEFRIILPDGQERVMQSSGEFIFDASNKPIRCIGIHRDITEQKNSEQALWESETLFRKLINGAPEGIFVHARERFLYLNPAMVKIFGANKAEDIIGTDLMDRIAPEYHEAIRDRIRLQVETGKASLPMDQVYLRFDGSRVPVETTAIPTRFRNQVADLVFVRDVSERKAIQDQRETQLIFSKALNKISENIILSDEPDHILEASNQIIGETLGVDRTLIYKISFKEDRLTGLCEWLRRPHPDIEPTVGEYSLELFRAPFTEIRKTQEHLESHCTSVGAPFMTDGSGEMLHGHFKIKSLIWYPFAFDQDGFHVFTINQILRQRQWSGDEIVFLESVAKLVSIALMKIKLLDERRRMTGENEELQKQFLRLQKMETIANLAGGIAHDFNNILFPIMGMSEMLLEDLPPGSGERDKAEQIFKAGQRGRDLVKQILAFSRQSEHKMMPTRIQSVLREVIGLSRSTIPTYIEIKKDIQQDCGMVMADPSQLHQIAMNIITNAFHAVEDTGGRISVNLKQSLLEASKSLEIDLSPGAYAVLSISDTGHGMSEELIGKIFEPYFTTKAHGKGTGLGLAVVYGIVKEHDGNIKVHSEIGKGSTFEIYLPLMKRMDGTEPIAETQDYRGGNERILLVDDEEFIANLLTQMLKRMGYAVSSYLHSVDALDAFRADPSSYDLVVTDMSMPNIPGDELSRKIKYIRSDVPIIICTGFSERIHKGNFKQMGIDGLLMKPTRKSELAKTVRKVLDKAEAGNQE